MVEGLQGFTRNVSHDLRGPLAGLSGVARLAEEALDTGDTDRARQLLEAIAPQTDRLQALVEGLLGLSRVSESELVRVSQPLSPLVHDALAQLALSPESAGDLARVKVDVDELPAAAVDAPMLRQVFVNLLGNAVRFSAAAAAGSRVHVGARRVGDRTDFFVADSGAGFPPEAMPRLFQPFALLHGGGLSRNGIGLSIVRRVIERHGGRVWAETRPGVGATFWFSLSSGR
jgi:signal transduction histidine kinase